MPWYFSCKSHWFCGLVQIHPQDVVVFILNTATESGWLSPWDPPLQWGKVHERIYRPATHPIHFAADSPDKIIAALRGRYFSFLGTCQGKVPPSCCARPFRCLKKNTGAFIATLRLQTQTVPWKFHKPSERDTDFLSTPLHKQGQELRSEQTVTPLHEQSPATYFLRLNNLETFVENAFWAQR